MRPVSHSTAIGFRLLATTAGLLALLVPGLLAADAPVGTTTNPGARILTMSTHAMPEHLHEPGMLGQACRLSCECMGGLVCGHTVTDPKDVCRNAITMKTENGGLGRVDVWNPDMKYPCGDGILGRRRR